MSTKMLYRLSAAAGILSGVCIIIGKLLIPLPNRQVGEVFDFFSPFCALLFATGIYIYQRRESGIFGGVAFIVLFSGLATVTSLDYFAAFVAPQLPDGMVDQLMESPAGTAFAVSGITFLVGEILFGISIIRAKIFPRVATLLFMVGMFFVPLGTVVPESVVIIGSIVAGIGLIWWGMALYELADRESTNFVAEIRQ